MRPFRKVKDTEEEKARARLLAHFEDNRERVFYSRQLEILFEREYFHWVTNRALRSLIKEGRISTETRRLDIGSEIKLVWHKSYRFYKRTANEVFALVNRYSNAATDGTLGMQGEHLVLAAFARQKFVLVAEETSTYASKTWTESNHDLDFIFERDGVGFGVEVKNTLGYLDVSEFVKKTKMALHIGVKPIFAVRALPRTWANILIKAGGFAMVMGYQFYPWTHKGLADEIRDKLGLPVDTPKRIEQGTMQRLENWLKSPKNEVDNPERSGRLLSQLEESYRPTIRELEE